MYLGGLTAAASVVLATRPYAIHLLLCDFDFEDANLLFFRHLRRRQATFGSLTMIHWGDSSLEQLCSHLHHYFEHVKFHDLPKARVAQVLAAPLQSISFSVWEEEDFAVETPTFTISARAVSFELFFFGMDPAAGFTLSFFLGVAASEHLKSLRCNYGELLISAPILDSVGNAFIEAIDANQNLELLELVDTDPWTEHMKNIFRVLQNHRSITTFKIDKYPIELDPDYSWLKRLIRYNRNIKVVNRFDRVETDGMDVDRIYAFNRFFHGSPILQQDPQATRPLLVGEALIHSAVNEFQRGALLLADHTDALCDMLMDV